MLFLVFYLIAETLNWILHYINNLKLTGII